MAGGRGSGRPGVCRKRQGAGTVTTGLRLDLLLLECVSVVVKSVPNGATVWDGGGRDLAAAKRSEEPSCRERV